MPHFLQAHPRQMWCAVCCLTNTAHRAKWQSLVESDVVARETAWLHWDQQSGHAAVRGRIAHPVPFPLLVSSRAPEAYNVSPAKLAISVLTSTDALFKGAEKGWNSCVVTCSMVLALRLDRVLGFFHQAESLSAVLPVFPPPFFFPYLHVKCVPVFCAGCVLVADGWGGPVLCVLKRPEQQQNNSLMWKWSVK